MTQDLTSSIQVLFQKAHVEALLLNHKQTEKWETYKNDLQGVEERMIQFRRDLNVPVLVPIGNKALFRGKLVHTNDILISLGDSYFTKGSVDQAVEIISRRKSKCDEMLENLSKERHLLESRARVRQESDVFPSELSKEIIEEYEENKEEKWRKEHVEKVKEYKKKLALMKQEQPSEINTDDDLWKRLEILEMEEELYDEMDRLESDSSNSDIESDDDGSSGSNSNQNLDLLIDRTLVNHPGYNKTPPSSIMKKPQISSVESNLSVLSLDEDKDEDYIKIYFKHSHHKQEINKFNSCINSPNDIYSKFSHCFDIKNKKIERRVSFAETPEVKMFVNEISKAPESCNPSTIYDNKQVDDLPVAFGDVVERDVPSENRVSDSRPISKFKSSRMVQKR